jgi:predicted RNase H-like HicB family nuclease
LLRITSAFTPTLKGAGEAALMFHFRKQRRYLVIRWPNNKALNGTREKAEHRLTPRYAQQTIKKVIAMETKKFMYYQDEDMFIGWLEDFPDYKTQGETLDELKENLKDIYEELTSGRIPSVLHVGELRVA